MLNMATPLAIKTTISSRNKMAQLNGGANQEEVLTTSGQQNNATNIKAAASMQPPSQIARNRALRPPAPPVSTTNGSTSTSRLANLANKFPSQPRDGGGGGASSSRLAASKTPAPTPRTTSTTTIATTSSTNFTTNKFQASTRLVPHTTNKIPSKTTTIKTAIIPSTSSRVSAAETSHSKTSAPLLLNSRSSSILSSVSSATTTNTNASKWHPSTSSKLPESRKSVAPTNHVPATTTTRKGLAKFANPIECQRQFQALSLKIRQLNEIIEAREKEIDRLQEQLKYSIDIGSGYATTVQYFAVKLKLDSETNLIEECEQLKARIEELVSNERAFNSKLKSVEDDYETKLQVENDLRNNIAKELEATQIAHSEILQKTNEAHQNELDDLKQLHFSVERELKDRVESLESELGTRCKELADLRKEHELLNSSYNKLEESLTKDKDARVKYAQEKINELQKDVESLNSVLEMRSERIHALEKDQILLVEVQNELMSTKDNNKALHQQLESVNAALDKKREQLETLMVEHEKVSQELKRERKERRRMTMRTEQLEYVLNESCVAETMGFNTSIRDMDSADHLV